MFDLWKPKCLTVLSCTRIKKNWDANPDLNEHRNGVVPGVPREPRRNQEELRVDQELSVLSREFQKATLDLPQG